jgi:ABC-2 type transport system permease protein
VSNVYFIFKKEIKSLFVSPLAYVVIAVFIGLTSFMFLGNLQEASMRDAFGLMSLLFIFVMPLLTMRTFAEELRNGTDELLMTSPLTLTQIVVGKYLAVMALLAAIMLLSGEYVVILAKYGQPDWGPIFTGYIGLLLMTGAFAALGVFMSSLSKNQMVVAVMTFGAVLFVIAIEALSAVFSGAQAAKVFEALSLINHYLDFEKGVVDSTHIIYYGAFIFLFLFFTVRRLDARRW